MGIDTEAQMIASIMSKKRAAGATHALIDIPIGPSAKVGTEAEALALSERFELVAGAIGLEIDILVTHANGPIGCGVGPRLEALDVLSVLRREPDAPADLREKSLLLAGRLLETVAVAAPGEGLAAAEQALDSGEALRKLDEIIDAQGRRELPRRAALRTEIFAREDGRITRIDCRGINALAKLAGAPTHLAAGLRVLRRPGEQVRRGDPLLEIHAQARANLEFALDYSDEHIDIFELEP
jgi:thymidine phosphorylase